MKIDITNKPGVLVTQHDLAILHACAEKIKSDPEQYIELVNCGSSMKNHYIIHTLLHFGVSCSQIRLSPSLE